MKLFVPRHDQCALATVDDAPIFAFMRDNADRARFVDNAEAAERIVLFEEWGARFPSYIATLENEPLVKAHGRKLAVVNCDDLARGFLPGLYASLTPRNFDPALHRAAAYPYVYNRVEDFAGAQAAPEYLFSFTGSLRSHPVRRRLYQLHAGAEGVLMRVADVAFHAHTEAQKRQYVEDMLASLFVLCPRGWSPASYRLFEAMQLGRCPVIISDDWMPIEGVDWTACAIRIREKDIAALPAILSRRRSEAEILGAAARAAWEACFSDATKFRFMFDQLAALFATGPFPDCRRRWRSFGFRRANGWAAHQRGYRLLARLSGKGRGKARSRGT